MSKFGLFIYYLHMLARNQFGKALLSLLREQNTWFLKTMYVILLFISDGITSMIGTKVRNTNQLLNFLSLLFELWFFADIFSYTFDPCHCPRAYYRDINWSWHHKGSWAKRRNPNQPKVRPILDRSRGCANSEEHRVQD